MPRGAETLMQDAPDKDPDDLARQRWGVIAPEGKPGELTLDAMAPIIRHREHEQHATARIYRARPI
jgi:hypothetical protein